jgi:hypothetical protein
MVLEAWAWSEDCSGVVKSLCFHFNFTHAHVHVLRCSLSLPPFFMHSRRCMRVHTHTHIRARVLIRSEYTSVSLVYRNHSQNAEYESTLGKYALLRQTAQSTDRMRLPRHWHLTGEIMRSQYSHETVYTHSEWRYSHLETVLCCEAAPRVRRPSKLSAKHRDASTESFPLFTGWNKVEIRIQVVQWTVLSSGLWNHVVWENC